MGGGEGEGWKEAEGKNGGHCIQRFHCCMSIEKGRGEENVAIGFGALTVVNVLSKGGENVGGIFSR